MLVIYHIILPVLYIYLFVSRCLNSLRFAMLFDLVLLCTVSANVPVPGEEDV